jgi:agarase
VAPPFVMKALWEQNQEVERRENEKDPKRASFAGDCALFAAAIAERYFRITGEALRKADPNHMNLGARFAYVPQREVIAAASPHLDAISFNCYAFEPMHALEAYGVHDKPCVLGEFSFRGDDAGLPNTRGAGPRVPTQADRAAAFQKFIEIGLRSPWLVGYHWFEHADQPAEGRFDGENSNYGIVNIRDELYEDLANAMKRVNLEAEKTHERG